MRLKRLLGVLLIVALMGLPGRAQAEPSPAESQLVVSSDVSAIDVVALPCAASTFTLRLHNGSDEAIVADAHLSAPEPVQLSRRLVSSYLPAGYTLEVPIKVRIPRGTPDGHWGIDLTAGSSTAAIEATATLPDLGGNLARSAAVIASSSHSANPACGTADGNSDSEQWAGTTWFDGTPRVWPDWIQYDLQEPQSISRVDLYSLDSNVYPADTIALSDWDIQVNQDGAWATVAEVRGNRVGMVSTTFSPVTTDAVRILCLDSIPHDYARIVELEIYTS